MLAVARVVVGAVPAALTSSARLRRTPRSLSRACAASTATAEGAMEVHQFPCLSDNYAFLLHDPSTGCTAVVDTPEVAPIEAALREKGWKLTHILNTHWHGDHTGGNVELKRVHACEIVGPARERKGADAIPGMDRAVSEDDVVKIGNIEARVIDVPGHTLGHVAYHFPAERKVFVGDALFALGCGRMFEGKATQMWNSVSKLMALPRETEVYCAHEYTLANAKFAMSVEPGNDALSARAKEVEEKRARGEWTVPTTIGLELETNPFCRPHSDEIRRNVGLVDADDVAVFKETRKRKDNF
jgi:hydroxyacylglutathione hydrolase